MNYRILSIKNPWAYAIIHLGKDIENRTWSPNYQGLVLIHASGSRPSKRDRELVEHMTGTDLPSDMKNGHILGVVELTGFIRNSSSIWAVPNHLQWTMRNPIPVATPYFAKGQLNLWRAKSNCPELQQEIKSILDRDQRLRGDLFPW